MTQTSETEYCVKQIQINGCDANTIIELHIFDCAGQSIFNQLDFNSKAVSLSIFYSFLLDIFFY